MHKKLTQTLIFLLVIFNATIKVDAMQLSEDEQRILRSMPPRVKTAFQTVANTNEEVATKRGQYGLLMFAGEDRECTCWRMFMAHWLCITECLALCSSYEVGKEIWYGALGDNWSVTRNQVLAGAKIWDEQFSSAVSKLATQVATAANHPDEEAGVQRSRLSLPLGPLIPWMQGPKKIDNEGYVFRFPIRDLSSMKQRIASYVLKEGGWRLDQKTETPGERVPVDETSTRRTMDVDLASQVIGAEQTEILQPLLSHAHNHDNNAASAM